MIQSINIVNEQDEALAVVPAGAFQLDANLCRGFLPDIPIYSPRISRRCLNEQIRQLSEVGKSLECISWVVSTSTILHG